MLFILSANSVRLLIINSVTLFVCFVLSSFGLVYYKTCNAKNIFSVFDCIYLKPFSIPKPT